MTRVEKQTNLFYIILPWVSKTIDARRTIYFYIMDKRNKKNLKNCINKITDNVVKKN